MKMFVIAVAAIFVLSSCGKTAYLPTETPTEETTEILTDEPAEVETEISYDKILTGDFSSVAGIYEYPSGNSFEMLPDGTTADNVAANDLYEGRAIHIENIKKNADGTYMWDESCYFDGEYMDGVACILYPVGVEVVTEDGRILDTDTTKIRSWSGQDAVYTEEYIAYKTDAIFTKEEFESLVIEYFTKTYPAEGDYVIFDSETIKYDKSYVMPVRFQPNYETMEANQLVEMVEVEKTTAKIFINDKFVCNLKDLSK